MRSQLHSTTREGSQLWPLEIAREMCVERKNVTMLRREVACFRMMAMQLVVGEDLSAVRNILGKLFLCHGVY